MFFSSRKKKKLAEAQAQEQEQARLKLESALQEAYAYNKNINTFYRICDMANSLPKKRQIVVVRRINTFKNDYEQNRCYLELAQKMHRCHKASGIRWMASNDGSLYAFHVPIIFDWEAKKMLKDFSNGGYTIQRIRYYYFNY